jgi:hypothetical protein
MAVRRAGKAIAKVLATPTTTPASAQVSGEHPAFTANC